MPLKDGKFTRGELAFIESYVQHQDRVRAENDAGIAPRSGFNILARAEVKAEIHRRIDAEMLELASLSVAKFRHILTSDKMPATVQADVAKYVHKAVTGAGEHAQAKEPHEMTAEELGVMIDKLQAQAASKAKAINPPDPGAIFD